MAFPWVPDVGSSPAVAPHPNWVSENSRDGDYYGFCGSAAEIEEQYDAAVSTEEKTMNGNWGGPRRRR